MQQRTPLITIAPQPETIQETRENKSSTWVARITFTISVIFLAIALLDWALRPYHYRLTLALLVVAMFAAILHSYTFENGK